MTPNKWCILLRGIDRLPTVFGEVVEVDLAATIQVVGEADVRQLPGIAGLKMTSNPSRSIGSSSSKGFSKQQTAR